jgi:hypothetical protein
VGCAEFLEGVLALCLADDRDLQLLQMWGGWAIWNDTALLDRTQRGTSKRMNKQTDTHWTGRSPTLRYRGSSSQSCGCEPLEQVAGRWAEWGLQTQWAQWYYYYYYLLRGLSPQANYTDRATAAIIIIISGGRSVSIVRSRTQTMEFSFSFFYYYFILFSKSEICTGAINNIKWVDYIFISSWKRNTHTHTKAAWC